MSEVQVHNTCSVSRISLPIKKKSYEPQLDGISSAQGKIYISISTKKSSLRCVTETLSLSSCLSSFDSQLLSCAESVGVF